MGRLTRAEAQRRNRVKVLAAAREEFGERGFRDAKIDVIAERAELTRGAIYSNFPSKRALYFAVLADDVAESVEAEQAADGAVPGTRGAVLGTFARAWLSRLPLATDEHRGKVRLGIGLLPEITADDHLRRPFAQLVTLNGIVLGLALERLGGQRPARRMVRVAELALTLLQGASQMAVAAPGFGEPFAVVRTCEQLADLDLPDEWDPAFAAYAPRPRPIDEAWLPPSDLVDVLGGGPVRFARDGIVLVLGLHRLEAVEHAVRAVSPGTEITVAVVTGDPGEVGLLARLVIADFAHLLRSAVPASARPELRIVHDDAGALAAAAGVPSTGDTTETAVRIEAGRVVARADGWGACHTIAPGRPTAR